MTSVPLCADKHCKYNFILHSCPWTTYTCVRCLQAAAACGCLQHCKASSVCTSQAATANTAHDASLRIAVNSQHQSLNAKVSLSGSYAR